MCVLGSVAVGMRVFVLEMFVLVAGVRMRVSELVVVVVVFVCVRSVMTVFVVCHCHLQSFGTSMGSIVLSTTPPPDGFAPVPRRA